MSTTALESLKTIDRELQLLSKTVSLLHWDQETYMPEDGIDMRSEQISLLSGMIHERATSTEVGDLLSELGADDEHPAGGDTVPADEKSLVRCVYRDYRREQKLPAALVRRFATVTSKGQSVWAKAREHNNFAMFRDHLAEIIDLNRERAACFGYDEHPYDALLDEYEPDMKASEVKTVFDQLQKDLVPIAEKIAAASQVDDAFLHREYPVDGQRAFSMHVLQAIGWPFSRGRLDESAHPFTTDIGSLDVRLTTRYAPDFLNPALFGTIHEAGHGLYELGVDPRYHGSSLASGTSLGIHESQSRTWENMIGRSREFWQFFYPELLRTFPAVLEDIDLDRFYRGINKVEASFIRVEADEVTYSLHIMLRFRLELALIEGSLNVDDLPDAWRSMSKELLGIVPDKDSDGVLQDIHWSMGAMGYFPTYALGNLFGAQFYSTMETQIPDMREQVASGVFENILAWQRQHIHGHGRAKTARELVMDISGRPLDARFFTEYLRTKYSEVYGL